MIILYGNLRKKFGKSLSCKVKSVKELVIAVESQRPGFRDAIDRDRNYVVRRGDSFKTGKDVSEAEIEMNFNSNTWHVLPLPMGYKSGVFKMLIGAILMVAGMLIPGMGFLVKIGFSMFLSGVASMLAPSPKVNHYSDREDPDKKPSYIFNGPLNRTESGGAVPLIYGKDVFTGSIFTSGGIEIGDIANE